MRTQKTINDISKAARRGAGPTTTRGLYRRSFLGLKCPAGVGGSPLARRAVLDSGESAYNNVARHGKLSVAADQRDQPSRVLQENGEDVEDLRQFRGNLSERERSMVQMTLANRERGGVRTIKRKLCREAQLSS